MTLSFINRRWYVQEEISGNADILQIAVWEEKTRRRIATLPDAGLDETAKIAVLREEARRLALAPEMASMLERFVYAAETRDEPKYSDGQLYREAKKDAYHLIDRINGLK